MKRNIHKYFHYHLWINSTDRQKIQGENNYFPWKIWEDKKEECVSFKNVDP